MIGGLVLRTSRSRALPRRNGPAGAPFPEMPPAPPLLPPDVPLLSYPARTVPSQPPRTNGGGWPAAAPPSRLCSLVPPAGCAPLPQPRQFGAFTANEAHRIPVAQRPLRGSDKLLHFGRDAQRNFLFQIRARQHPDIQRRIERPETAALHHHRRIDELAVYPSKIDGLVIIDPAQFKPGLGQKQLRLLLSDREKRVVIRS